MSMVLPKSTSQSKIERMPSTDSWIMPFTFCSRSSRDLTWFFHLLSFDIPILNMREENLQKCKEIRIIIT